MRGATSRAATCLVTCRRSNRCRSFSPLRTIRAMSDDVLRRLSPRFDAIYAATCRPSIPPEHLLRRLLLQVLYSVRSGRMLMEQVEYNLLFRWFVRLGMDDDVRVGADDLHEQSGSAAGG